MRFIKTALVLLFLAAAGLAAAVYYLYGDLRAWNTTRLPLAAPTVIQFPRGCSLEALSEELAAKRVIDRTLYFRLSVRLFSDYSRFQAGTYRFDGTVSPQEVIDAIIEGRIFEPVVLKLTIPEGFTYRLFSDRLVQAGIGSPAEFQALFADKGFLQELKVPSPSLEGYLYPATYSFLKVPGPKEAVRRAVETFWRRLPTGYLEALEPLNLTLNEAVTLASLVELETPVAQERPLVSEVIWRRLRARMPLAIDSSLIYGIADYNGNLSRKHLQDAKNVYNTRVHLGLPPTPIGSPSRASLLAVLKPASEGNYYFVVDADNPGRHLFSKSFQEHRKKVQKLIQFQRTLRK